MNTIVKEENKLDKLCQDGYKIIYPNAIDGLGFDLEIVESYQYSSTPNTNYPIEIGKECEELNLYEKYFKYRNSLFLVPYNFKKVYDDKSNLYNQSYILSFDNGKAKKEFKLSKVLMTSDNPRTYNRFTEKINYVLFNPERKVLVFYLDDNFKTKKARKEEEYEKILSQKETKLEEDLDSLFNS
jgi:hypothetical protein